MNPKDADAALDDARDRAIERLMVGRSPLAWEDISAVLSQYREAVLLCANNVCTSSEPCGDVQRLRRRARRRER
jgi:hypothetical protein